MSRPNDKGLGDCGAQPPKTYQNQHAYFANEDAIGKAFVDRQSLLARLNYTAAEPSIRSVGDMLRQIGGR